MIYAGDAVWVVSVYGVDATDSVLGGANGPANRGVFDLAKRTSYLKGRIEALDAALTSAVGNWSLGTIPDRMTAVEGLATSLGSRLTTQETKTTTLQASFIGHEARIVALEAIPVATDLATSFFAT